MDIRKKFQQIPVPVTKDRHLKNVQNNLMKNKSKLPFNDQRRKLL